MKAFLNYLQEVRLEISKVVWPKREETIKLTLIVILISGIIALYLGAIDFVLVKILERFIVS